MRPTMQNPAARSGQQDDTFGTVGVGGKYTVGSKEEDDHLGVEKPFSNGNGYGNYAAYQHTYARFAQMEEES